MMKKMWTAVAAALILAVYLLLVRGARKQHPELAYRRYAHRYRMENMPTIPSRDSYLSKNARRGKRES